MVEPAPAARGRNEPDEKDPRGAELICPQFIASRLTMTWKTENLHRQIRECSLGQDWFSTRAEVEVLIVKRKQLHSVG